MKKVSEEDIMTALDRGEITFLDDCQIDVNHKLQEENGDSLLLYAIGNEDNNSVYKELIARHADIYAENDEPEYGMHHNFHHLYADGRERLARVMWDDRWDFYEEGEPMPFEQTERYTERLRRKRLTNDMVLVYAKAPGWDLRDPACWTSDQDAWYLSVKAY